MNNPIPRRLTKKPISPSYILWRLNNYYQRQLKKELKLLNITYVEFIILEVLSNRITHTVSQRGLQHILKIDKNMTSEVVRNLERKSLIKREKYTQDNKNIYIHSTPQAIELVKLALKVVTAVDKKILTSIKFVV